MKRIMAIGMVFFNIIILSITCFAKENYTFAVPAEIPVENGKLVLVGKEYDQKNIQPRYVYKVVTDGGNLNVRKEPKADGKIVGQVPNGSYFDASFEQTAPSPWMYGTGTSTTGGEIKGYVNGNYLGDSGMIH